MALNITDKQAKELQKEFGSPLYLFDESIFLDKINEMKDKFSKEYSNFKLAYSFKTNYLSRVCQIALKQKVTAETISGFEYDIAKKIGYNGENIIVNGPYKPEEELEKYVDDSCLINVDNLEEIEKLEDIASKKGIIVKIGIRINAKIGKLPWSKFGFSINDDEAKKAIEIISKREHLKLVGLHMHIGTNIIEPEYYKQAILNLLLFIKEIEKKNVIIEYIDMGGGFPSKGACPVNYNLDEWDEKIDLNKYVKAICEPLNKYFRKEKPLLIIESGRFLIDESFSLISQVFSVKNIRGINSVFIDAGVNILPSAYYRKHEILTFSRSEKILTDIYGPLCMQVDLIESGIKLPPLKVDDIVIIKTVGAYELSQSIQFIRQRPVVVSIFQDRIHLCKKKETAKEIMALDVEVKDE